MPVFIDITGKKFNRLSVIELDKERSTNKRKYWRCLCDCGNYTSQLGCNIKGGKAKSCGCLIKDVQLISAAKRKQFTKEQVPVRHIWKLMLRRCYNPKDNTYKHYGARGIKVCERWHNFDFFWQDMGPRPSGYSLERVDNNGDYEPSNCKWATQLEQVNNRRTSRLEWLNGRVQTLAQWCREYNRNQRLVNHRLSRGWSLIDALEKPPRPLRRQSK